MDARMLEGCSSAGWMLECWTDARILGGCSNAGWVLEYWILLAIPRSAAISQARGARSQLKPGARALISMAADMALTQPPLSQGARALDCCRLGPNPRCLNFARMPAFEHPAFEHQQFQHPVFKHPMLEHPNIRASSFRASSIPASSIRASSIRASCIRAWGGWFMEGDQERAPPPDRGMLK